ncbi:Gfo/Idh/MocA family protein [Kluyvera georgiana]|uniref:Gfo/Idh/MocA family protein n=1 Tax=Kluyvera georgiana TaxID=73098 RepID=UPI003D9933B8
MKKVAVIGLGNIASRHRRNIRILFPNVSIYAMSSSERTVTDLTSDCDGYLANISAVINEQVDMVVVASPSTCHLKHSAELIRAGIPVLIEKPVAATSEDAAKLMEIAVQYKTPVAVGYCLRYLPSASRVKKMLEEDFVGKIYNVNIDIGQYLPDWRPSKDYRDSVSANKHLGGGALLELSHEIDYAQWLFGDLCRLHSIIRSSDELEMNVEALADVTAASSSGAIVNIHLDFLQKKAWRQCHIIGSKGRLVWDLIRNEILFYNGTGCNVMYSEPEWDKNGMYIEMLKDFINKIYQQDNQCISLETSVKVVTFIEEIKKEVKFGALQ